MKRLLILALTGITVWTGVASAVEKPTLAVLPFITRKTVRVAGAGHRITPQQVETEFTDTLLNVLVKARKFSIVDRNYLNKVLNEYKITESEYSKPGEDQRIGKLLSADYLLIGEIDRLTFRTDRKYIKLAGQTVINRVATLKMHFRITETKSGKITATEDITEKLTTQDVKRLYPYSKRKFMDVADFRDLLLRRAAERSGKLVLSGVFPIKVIGVYSSEIAMNRGRGAGIKRGEKFEIYSVGEAMIDPDTGENLGGGEEKVADAIVTRVFAKYSRAKIYNKNGDIKRGDTCRPLQGEEDELPEPVGKPKPPPAYPRATSGY